jgi:hypothetical protein
MPYHNYPTQQKRKYPYEYCGRTYLYDTWLAAGHASIYGFVRHLSLLTLLACNGARFDGLCIYMMAR